MQLQPKTMVQLFVRASFDVPPRVDWNVSFPVACY